MQAFKSPHIVGLFSPKVGRFLTLVWSAQAAIENLKISKKLRDSTLPEAKET